MDRQTFLWFLPAQQCEYHRRLFQGRALNYLTKNNFLNKAIPYPGGVKSHFWWIPIFIKTEKKSYEVSRDGIHAAGAITWAPPSSWKREQHLLEEPNHLLVVTTMHLRRVTWPPPGEVSSLWIMHSPDNVSRFFFFAKTRRNYCFLQCNTENCSSSGPFSMISLLMGCPSPRCSPACPASCPWFLFPALVPASHCATLIPLYRTAANSNTLS